MVNTVSLCLVMVCAVLVSSTPRRTDKAPRPAPPACYEGKHLICTKQYVILESRGMKWDAGRRNCEAKEFHGIASVLSSEEESKLENYIKENEGMVRVNGTRSPLWLGAHDIIDEASFKWFPSGDMVLYNNWAKEEPVVDFTKNCAVVGRNLNDTIFDFKWYAESCFREFVTVCQFYAPAKHAG